MAWAKAVSFGGCEKLKKVRAGRQENSQKTQSVRS